MTLDRWWIRHQSGVMIQVDSTWLSDCQVECNPVTAQTHCQIHIDLNSRAIIFSTWMYLVYTWYILGIYLVYTCYIQYRNIPSIFMVYTWYKAGIFQKKQAYTWYIQFVYVWNMHGIYMQYTCHYMIHTWDIHGISSRYHMKFDIDAIIMYSIDGFDR